MQRKLNAASNRAATLELHNQGLSQRQIATRHSAGNQKTRVAQIFGENNSKNDQSG